eukprot:COSAG02_NODE_6579_length_3482_cov_2.415903_2_plen_636_part_00
MGRVKLGEPRGKPWKTSGLRKGSTVGDGLEVRAFLGKGAFGAVYRVKRQADGQNYALKIVDIRNRSQRGKQGAVNEIRVLAAVESEFVIRFWEAFVEYEKLHIVTEFAQGSDLARRFEELSLVEQRLSEDTVWSYFAQLCLGLQALHSVNILHRDLKPANVLLVSDDRLKIADLGIAKVLNGDEPVAKTQCGTPAYFSPELWRNQPYDDRSDVWALGCILYEMVMMKLPFHKAKHVLWGVFSPPDHADTELNTLIKTILVVNSKERPDVAGLLEHERVKALTSSLLPAASADREAKPGAEDAQSAAESKGAVPMISQIKVPRQKKALAGRDWLPSPRYATSSGQAADEAESADTATGRQGKNRRGQGTLGGSMAGQHRSPRQEERLVPLPIPTYNEQAALRERFAAYSQQHQGQHQQPEQHEGRNRPVERPNNQMQSFASTHTPRSHRPFARGNASDGLARAEHPRARIGTSTIGKMGRSLHGKDGPSLAGQLLHARPDSRDSAALRARMSLTQVASRVQPQPPRASQDNAPGPAAAEATLAPSSARQWLDAHQLTDRPDSLHDSDLQSRFPTPPMHPKQVHSIQGRNTGRDLDTLALAPRPPQAAPTAGLDLPTQSGRSGSFPRSSGFGAFVMV